MPLIDPFDLGYVRPDPVSETRAFPAQIVDRQGNRREVDFSLTLRGLDLADEYVVQDSAFAYTRAYAPTDGSLPSALIEVGDGESKRPVAMSFQLCNAVATVLIAQVGAERYSFEQLCAWMFILGDTWGDVIRWSDELSAKAKGAGKA
jgi:hypothetical protein